MRYVGLLYAPKLNLIDIWRRHIGCHNLLLKLTASYHAVNNLRVLSEAMQPLVQVHPITMSGMQTR